MMKRDVFPIIIFCLTIACNRYPDPEVKMIKDYSFSFQQVQGGRFFAGEWVSDSIVFKAVNNKAPLKDSLKVMFEIVKGGGTITKSSLYTDKNGNVYTGWKLGSETFDQKLRANVYDLSGSFLNSSDLIAYGFRINEWDTLPNSMEADISGMAADTINKITLMISSGALYKEGERYYIWNAVTGQYLASLKTIVIDRDLVFYVSTWDGNIVKSTDHGISWATCSRPYPGGVSNIQMTISNDNLLWVYAYNNPAKYSKDKGQTWTEISMGFSYWGYGDVFRLKDGSLLLQGENCCTLARSFDEGLTWNEIPTPGRPTKLFVNDKDEIFITSQQGGLIIYKSTDYGVTYSYVYAVAPDIYSTMQNSFNMWSNSYYIAIQGWGILKSSDLTHYDIFWVNSNLKNLFIDHNGVMLALYANWQAPYQRLVYYRKNSLK